MTVVSIPLAAESDIGEVQLVEAANPPTVLGGAWTGSIAPQMSIMRKDAVGLWSYTNVWARFNTASHLGAGFTVASARLLIYLSATPTVTTGHLAGGWYTPGWTGGLPNVGHMSLSVSTSAFDYDTVGKVNGDLMAITLTNPVANIDVNGYTSFVFQNNIAIPSVSNTLCEIDIHAWASSLAGPVLEVTGTPGAGPIGTVQCPAVGTYEFCQVLFNLLYANGRPWTKGIVTAELSHSCYVRTTDPTVQKHASGEAFPLTLDATGVGTYFLFTQNACCPLNGDPQSAVHYKIRFPDGAVWKVVIPDQATALFTDLTLINP